MRGLLPVRAPDRTWGVSRLHAPRTQSLSDGLHVYCSSLRWTVFAEDRHRPVSQPACFSYRETLTFCSLRGLLSLGHLIVQEIILGNLNQNVQINKLDPI